MIALIRYLPWGILLGSFAFLVSGIAALRFDFSIGYALLLIAVLLFLAWMGVKRLTSKRLVNKQKHNFIEEEYSANGRICSKLHYKGDLPLLIIYTTDPLEKGRLLGKHTGGSFLKLYDQYIRYLPIAMRFVSGNYLRNPLNFIQSEIERLQLHLPDFLLAEMKGYLEEVNKMRSSRKPISLEEFKALYVFGDIYKGFGACSVAVKPFELMRNLDWYSMGVLGDTTLLLFYPVRQPKADGPKKVLSITFPPCMLGLSMANDKGLVVTLNETTRMESKRNFCGGYPQFLLLRELVEHSSSVAEAISFISRHPPAASHLLAMMDKNGEGAIVQMLPTGSEELFSVRPLEKSFVLATNHYVDKAGNLIPGSEAIASSLPRYLSMERALMEGRSSKEVLAAANCAVTMQAMVFTHRNDQFSLDFNYDNFRAGSIDNSLTRLNLTEMFKTI